MPPNKEDSNINTRKRSAEDDYEGNDALVKKYYSKKKKQNTVQI